MAKDTNSKLKTDKTVTIFDVAAMAGISTSTVSNVMKNTGHFSEKTRLTVMAAVETLHYVPNIAAQSLSMRRSNLIGVYGINLKYLNDWPNAIMWGILNQFKGTNYAAYVVNTSFPFELDSDDQLLRQARAKFLCGIVLIGWNIRQKDVELFREFEIPVAVIEQKNPTVDCINVDHFRSGYLGGQHLAKRGCKYIGYVCLDGSAPAEGERLKGFKAALKEHGRSFDRDLIFRIPYSAEGETYAPAVKVAAKIAKMKPRPDGLFCTASSDAGVGLVDGFKAAGLVVPQDIAVVGWDDMETIKHAHPAMTSLRQPFSEMGKAAAECIIQALGNKKPMKAKNIILQPELIVRESA